MNLLGNLMVPSESIIAYLPLAVRSFPLCSSQ